ncbi:adhesion G protein-coupled receptor E3-like [Chanos chanos]|uniref:Adhesion G protein-coupled receptor E3-like n=1 Tax=Chanos chanos TaxID=29144 RepID=A0A6J2VU67_CHACN|nr:adhesion G protein-coupled receptor E3-like [Chanos chanos]
MSDQPSYGRYTVEKSETGEFIVTISKLQKSDAGTYWCGVGGSKYDEVDVTVVGVYDGILIGIVHVKLPKSFILMSSISGTAQEGQHSRHSVEVAANDNMYMTLDITSRSDSGYVPQPGTRKFVCKKPCGGNDVFIMSDQPSHGRYTVETSETGEFIVTISKLQKSDAGTYRCGVGGSVYHDVDVAVVGVVKPTDTEELLNFTSNTTEVKVYTVGPNATLESITRLNNTAAFLDIDIISIAKNNKGHASVAFMTYDNMSEILKPTFFPSKKDTVNTMMSTVVSASLPKTTNKTLTNPVNFTLKHIREMDPTGTLYCVYWDKTAWSTNGCVRISEENSNDTICSCKHLSTFALLMQTEKIPEWSDRLGLLSTIAFAVGLTFLFLAILTFILFRKNSRVSSVLRLNLCICLLLAHLLFLLTQRFLAHSSYKVLLMAYRPPSGACAVFAGILHFLLLSAFVWMFLEAITLFISVKNLSKIKSRRREVLHWKYQLVIGYVVPTLVVGVSVAVQRDGYDSETCWIKLGTSFVWSFLGPVCFILAMNLILFITIIITLQCTLMHLSGDVSQIKTSRTMVFKALAQFFILGCPWILGFLTNVSMGLEIIFLLLTSQQGTFIFLVHCVLSEEVNQNQFQKPLNCFSCICFQMFCDLHQ